jgi:glycosyltransferase involved in cell wall biosynthesis
VFVRRSRGADHGAFTSAAGMSLFSRAGIEIRDRLRRNRKIRQLAAHALLGRTRICRPDSDVNQIARSIAKLCAVARLSQTAKLTRKVEAEIQHRIRAIGERPVEWSSLIAEWRTDRIEKAVVLKPRVSERERGVVLISFEYQWARLMAMHRLDEFARRYTVVLAPTWSPPHALENTLFPARYPDSRLFSLISNAIDRDVFPRLSKKFLVVPLYASNWVNPALYEPVPFAQKDIDIVMLAGFGVYKRHFALFQALRDVPRTLRVVLIGTPAPGRTMATLFEEARQYGVQDRVEIREGVSDQEVNQCLARAKISIILSNQEGSCVAVVESLFADTPVGLYEDAIVGSRAFINEQTGRLFRRDGLGAQLRDFLSASRTCSPRKWALENGLCCHGSTAVLNRALKASALEGGEQWTRDIAVHHWRFDPVLLREEDRRALEPAYEDIRSRFGIQIGKS